MATSSGGFLSHGAHAWPILVTSMVLLAGAQGAAMGQGADTQSPQETAPLDHITIRVGLPKIVQGPGPGIPDSSLTIARLPDGRFRGFSANATTYAIDGDSPWDMAGKPVPVLGPAPRGEPGESGEWIGHVERSGSKLLGWVHDETGDRWGAAVTSLQSISNRLETWASDAASRRDAPLPSAASHRGSLLQSPRSLRARPAHPPLHPRGPLAGRQSRQCRDEGRRGRVTLSLPQDRRQAILCYGYTQSSCRRNQS